MSDTLFNIKICLGAAGANSNVEIPSLIGLQTRLSDWLSSLEYAKAIR